MADNNVDEEQAKLNHCYKLVGEYLWRWSIMESQLNGAVCEALEINVAHHGCLSSNIDFRSKINILRSCLGKTTTVGDKKIDAICSELNALHDARNIVTHCFFAHGESGDQVMFFKWPRKGTSLQDEAWSVSKFQSEYEKMYKITEKLRAIQKLYWQLQLRGRTAVKPEEPA